jgi:hypothetical protein
MRRYHWRARGRANVEADKHGCRTVRPMPAIEVEIAQEYAIQ